MSADHSFNYSYKAALELVLGKVLSHLTKGPKKENRKEKKRNGKEKKRNVKEKKTNIHRVKASVINRITNKVMGDHRGCGCTNLRN